MDKTLAKDLSSLKNLLETTLEKGLDYLNDIDNKPTSVPNIPMEKGVLQEQGNGGALALKEFTERFEKIMAASTGPRYWGFVTGGSTPAALMGDMLATIYDQNTQTDKGHGDISALVELETIQLLLDLFDLPNDFLSGFVTGATMSNFTCLGVARQWIGKELNTDVAKEGVRENFKVLSATPHSSAIKALSMLGMGSNNLTKVPTLGGTREAVDVKGLENEIHKLNGAPFILITSGGTVNTVDFDDMQAIAKLKTRYNFWWHIDAAFGGFASISPQYKHLVAGWENADSITIDGHKWLNVPYESAFYFIKEKHRLLQVETFQNSNAPYLGDPLENFDYLNFLPENSRRFKALASWFTLKAYGKAGYRDIVERNIALAQDLGEFMETHEAFELLAPVRLNTVCFTLNNETDPEKVQAFLDRVNASGKVFMTPTVFNGRKGIRAALVNWRTTEKDVETVKQELLKHVTHSMA